MSHSSVWAKKKKIIDQTFKALTEVAELGQNKTLEAAFQRVSPTEEFPFSGWGVSRLVQENLHIVWEADGKDAR